MMNKDQLCSTDDELTTDDEFEYIETEQLGDTSQISQLQNGLGDNTKESNYQLDESAEFFEKYADKYLEFTDNNPTTFHVIDYFRTILEEHGFRYIAEDTPIGDEISKQVNEGGLFYTVRSNLSIVGFVIGGEWDATRGIGVIGSHVDSLSIKLKPISKHKRINGYNMLGVAGYSSTLTDLCLDRDFGIGGTILVRKADGTITRKLVKSSPHPIAKIPKLAEHFGEVADKKYNQETQMVPIVGFGENKEEPSETEKASPLYEKHPLELLRYISKISETPLDQIVELELELFDVQNATRGGLSREFIFAPRIDDRLCSFSAIYSLIEFGKTFNENFKEYDGFNAVLLVDNEEIGSGTRTGAKGKFLNAVLDRVISIRGKKSSDANLVFANSVILSADVTHALNPNFKQAYLKDHFPVPNKGLTIKIDPNGHVMTDTIGLALLGDVARKENQQLQTFHIRNDGRSGSTIGPALACDTGARVIDVGLPQLSMHSIRAMCGFKEVGLGVNIFKSFFKHWRNSYNEIDY
ncbi:unnamed protein product [Debaryomyces fabryi]|nr:unnamed protein product [Debaryomyces fabryi]